MLPRTQNAVVLADKFLSSISAYFAKLIIYEYNSTPDVGRSDNCGLIDSLPVKALIIGEVEAIQVRMKALPRLSENYRYAPTKSPQDHDYAFLYG